MPIEVTPENVTCVGPIVISVASVEQQDPGLAAWLAARPTILINLGSIIRYTEEQARAMVGALAVVMRPQPEVQELWKLHKYGEYGDAFLPPVQDAIRDGRLKLEKWLAADPIAILKSGHIIAAVHHGGANCYHEAIV